MDIKDLVQRFEEDLTHYKSTNYNESQLRTDFLDPLFFLLGWDISNDSGKPTNVREVLVEESLKTTKRESTKKPDYTFRLNSERRYFVEAKKPSIDISKEHEPARQLRRYGFTARLKVSVLSNFEYLAIYDCSSTVKSSDNVTHSRIKIWHYSEYISKFDEIYELLSKDSVYTGSFDASWQDIAQKIEHFSVDSLFIKQINRWRLGLAENFKQIKPFIDDEQLNDLTQAYINSIVFLRVCEDRDLEVYESLLELSTREDYDAFRQELLKADKKYNSGLFDLPYADVFVTDSNNYIWTIIQELYYPESTYSFSVFSSDILGNIYEVFLGEKVDSSSGELILKPKAENVDRDVVTTPTNIIQDILEVCVFENFEKENLESILKRKFADIACGSGAFLLELYQLLQDMLVDHYLENQQHERLIEVGRTNYKLNFRDKRLLLENCIYGVDKDYNAVTAARFGLLLKLLEGEDNTTITIPALPILNKNIVYGNSLLDSNNISSHHCETGINPFDFEETRFDVIVGNPPYMSTENMKNITPDEYELYKKEYTTAYKQFDKYYIFIERAMNLLNKNGILGYILPSKFMKTGSGKKLREFIVTNGYLHKMVAFGANQMFRGKTTYTCLLFLRKAINNPKYYEVKNLIDWLNKQDIAFEDVNEGELTDATWALGKVNKRILGELENRTVPLSEIVGKNCIANGIQTSANKVYIHKAKRIDKNYIYFDFQGNEYMVEKELTRPYYETSRVKGEGLYSYSDITPNSFVIYPYRVKSGVAKLVPLSEINCSYPCLYEYLMVIKPILNKSNRSIKPTPLSADEWHRYGRSHGLNACDTELKIVVGVLSAGYKYSIDRNRTFVSSGGTAGYCPIKIPEDCDYSVFYIQALLNSKYCEWFVSQYGEINRGKYLSRGTKIIEKLPIVPIDFTDHESKKVHDSIASLQSNMNSLYMDIEKAGSNDRVLIPLKRKFDKNKQKMEKRLKELFNLGDLDASVPSVEELYENL